MAGEVTLLEQAKLITNPQAVKIINLFAMEFIINALMPYTGGVMGYFYPWTVMDLLPTVAPRDFNADFTGDHGKSSNYALPWKNYGGKLTIDEALTKGNPTGALRQQLMQLQAIAKQWAQHIFKGTGGVQVYGIDLFLANFFPNQIISAGASANGDLLTMAMMDNAFRLITKGPNTAIFCTQLVVDRLSYLARTNASGQQNIFWAENSFGMKVMTYNGVPIYTMIDPLSGADILPSTEVDGHVGAAATTSSLYILNLTDDEVHAFSPDPSDIIQVKESPSAMNGTNFDITRLIKNAGIVVETPRAAVRIKHIKAAVA